MAVLGLNDQLVFHWLKISDLTQKISGRQVRRWSYSITAWCVFAGFPGPDVGQWLVLEPTPGRPV
jgi:hypothetical protein